MNYRDIDNYPADIQPIIGLLLAAEEHLSDGYLYYVAGNVSEQVAHRRTIAYLVALARALKEAALAVDTGADSC